MASGAYSRGVLKILDGTIDLDTTALKVMLEQSGYNAVFDPDQASLDVAATTNDLTGQEATATGYTGGFGGAGRKAATVTLSEDTANNRVVTIIGDLTWTALGGATNNTLGGCALVREVTNDGASIPIAWLQFTANVTTNGSDILVDFDGTNGNVRWTV
jgi:hypothetical protein